MKPRTSAISRLTWLKLAMVVAAPLERLAGGLVHALLGGQVFLHDGRHVHLGVADPQRLDLDVTVFGEPLDDLARDAPG